MRTLVLAALCALLGHCRCELAGGGHLSRPKRTIRMLESLFGSMRDTFGPLTAPALPPAQPPSELILATKYPVGVKYALYPTVRMHIRPVQQHLIYMQSIPALPPAPLMRPVRPPFGTASGATVEFLRPMPPMMRLPKTKTTTTIHYEIIPLPVPVHSEPPPPPPPPPPLSVPHSSSSLPSYDETDDPHVPWSLDELPPPVPTSVPLNPDDEPNVPWNLHALPPPVATKQPRGHDHDDYGWPMRSAHQSFGNDYALPVFDKKLLIPAPAHDAALRNRHRPVFRPSPLQSEIIVQPSVELAAYSETHTLTDQPKEYLNRLRNLNSPKPQVFPHRNNRLRRDTSSASSMYYVETDHSPVVSSHQRAAEPRILSTVSTPDRLTIALNYEKDLTKASRPQPEQFPKPVIIGTYSQPDTSNQRQSLANLRPAENRDSRSEHSSSMQFLRNIGHDIRISPLLSDASPEQYVLITPRPVNYTRRLNPDPAKTERLTSYSRLPVVEPQQLSLFQAAAEDKRRPREREVANYFERSKGHLRFPPTGSLSKLPRRRENRPSLFSTNKSPLSVDNFFKDSSSEARSSGRGSAANDFLQSDLDKVEYFEPIIIDIDEEKRKADLGPKVEFKLKNFELKKSTREPLRLPGRLHETIDNLSAALRHPPIFDMESEADEPQAMLVVLGNEIT